MTEDRRATRHEPITTTVLLRSGKELSFIATPAPWRERNDLGEAVLKMYTAAMNNLINTSINADSTVSIEGSLFESQMNYDELYALTYGPRDENDKLLPLTKEQKADFTRIDFDSMIDVLEAGLIVNGLDRMTHMLDPDRKKDQPTGESEPATPAPIDAGEKMELPTASG